MQIKLPDQLKQKINNSSRRTNERNFQIREKGQSFVNSETKLNEERKLLNNKYPGELNKFVFGNIKDLSEEYVKELFDLYKKFKKTEAKNLNDFLTEIQ